MAGGRQLGARHHLGDLLPQQGDAARPLVIGIGGEQADKAALAIEIAVGVVGFHPDIIHVAVAMHLAAGMALGDDQGLAGIHEGAHFRRQARPFGAGGIDHARIFVRQHAQAGTLYGFQAAMGAILRQHIIARAQEGEMVVGQPVQEGDILFDIGAFGRGGGQTVAGLLQPRHHPFPVAHRDGARCKRIAQAVRHLVPRLAGDGVADQGDDAGGATIDQDDGMEGRAHPRAAGQRGLQRRVKQERPVVIDADHHRLMRLVIVQQGDIAAARCVPCDFCEQSAGQRHQPFGAHDQHIVGQGAVEQRVEEGLQLRIADQGAGLRQMRLRGARLFCVGGADGVGHGRLPYESGEADRRIITAGRRSAQRQAGRRVLVGVLQCGKKDYSKTGRANGACDPQ